MTIKALLSKSTFLKGLQCDKHLYLYKHHYYWQEKASYLKYPYSVKAVLPSLVSELCHTGLEIAVGGSVSIAYGGLLEDTDTIKIEQTQKNLIEYCKPDTLAMVEILNNLYKI